MSAAISPSASLNRRRFFGRLALAGGAVALPALIPASALGRGGAVARGRVRLGGCMVGKAFGNAAMLGRACPAIRQALWRICRNL